MAHKEESASVQLRTIAENVNKEERERKNKTIDINSFTKMNKTIYAPHSNRKNIEVVGTPHHSPFNFNQIRNKYSK